MTALSWYSVGLCLGLIIGACCGFLTFRVVARREHAERGRA